MKDREFDSKPYVRVARRPSPISRDVHPALQLQRTAGNRAVNQLLSPAEDRASEAEADNVAMAASVGLSPQGARRAVTSLASGGRIPLPSELQAALRPHVGDASKVTVDSGTDAGDAAASIGARAFADEGRVHLGHGEASAPDAAGLLLHEAAHAVRHTSRRDGDRHLVHAKLKGTREALRSAGGGTTSGIARKLTGKLTNWDKILKYTTAYEAAEDSLLARGPLTPDRMSAGRVKLLALLGVMEESCLAWQEANGGDAASETSEKAHAKTLDSGAMETSDKRTKAGRRQAVSMLLPRVRREMEDLRSGTWATGMSLSDTTRTGGKDAANKGQMSSVDLVQYDDAGTKFEGFFKSEKGFEGGAPGHQVESGIRQMDPNYGARSVAMYRLDQLLNTGVIARSEFATHNNQMGVVSEKAKGTRASDAKFAVNDAEHLRSGGGSISAEDAVLQSCLNKLQVIDAIAGQLDRHMGNFFIQTDANGKVTGVTGIDLDMAFGQEMTDPTIANKPGTAAHYRGVPALVDYDLGQRLLQITDADIEQAIKGLLSDAEVTATKARFRVVQDHARALANSGALTRNWDSGTAKQGRAEGPSKFSFQFSDISSYTNVLVDEASSSEKLAQPVGKAGDNVLDDWATGASAELPSITVNSIRKALRGVVPARVVNAAYAGQVGVDQAPAFAVALIQALLKDSSFSAKMEVAVQEGQMDLTAMVTTEVDRQLPMLVARGLRVGVGH